MDNKQEKSEEQFWRKEQQLRKEITDLEDDMEDLKKTCKAIEEQKLTQIDINYMKGQIAEGERMIKRKTLERERLLEEYKKRKAREIEQLNEQTSKSSSEER